jgi:hypothetical protein
MSIQGNIFVTDEGNATITDISVYTFASQALLRLQPDAPQEFSVYHPPEFSAATAFIERAKAMDVYSFAMTTFAVSHAYFFEPCIYVHFRFSQAELHRVGSISNKE